MLVKIKSRDNVFIRLVLIGLIVLLVRVTIRDLLELNRYSQISENNPYEPLPIGGVNLLRLWGYFFLDLIALMASVAIFWKISRVTAMLFIIILLPFAIQRLFAQAFYFVNYDVFNIYAVASAILVLLVLGLLIFRRKSFGIIYTNSQLLLSSFGIGVVMLITYAVNYLI